MQIHVVTVDSGWILQRLANELATFCGYSVSTEPRDDVDVNYYFDFQNCFQQRGGSGKQVAFFTHFHEDSADYVKKNYMTRFKQLDGVVCMCKRYENRLEDIFIMHGVKCQITRIRPGDPTRHFALKKPKIGIFQRGGVGGPHETNTGHDGKGHGFMLQLVRDHTDLLRNFEWHFVGQGWRQVVQAMEAQGIKVFWFDEPNETNAKHTNTTVMATYESRLHDVDCVLVPSLWEGGPMIIPQALAAGVKVISADVGWANEFPLVDLFPPGNHEKLVKHLTYLNPDSPYRGQLEDWNWQTYKKRLEAFCGAL